MDKQSKANLTPIRQATQFSCVAASLTMSMKALGFDCDEETVNKVLGARPMVGAAWEECMAAAQHYGFRCTLVTPSTLTQVRIWTDAGTPVIIGWNTGNEWSHASVIFDVDDENVYVADPNIPDPTQLVRVVPHKEFYEKWFEKASGGYKIRRPAMAVEREVSKEGRQMVASIVDDVKDVWSPTKGLLVLRKPQSLLDVRNKLNQFCIPKFHCGARTVERPKGTVWYSFHWSNAQKAWDVIRERDPVMSVDGADLMVAVSSKAIDSTTGKPFALRDMQMLAKFLRNHVGYGSSMEGGFH